MPIVIFSSTVNGVLLGIARAAVDALTESVRTTPARGGASLLRDDPAIQLEVARAEGSLAAARALLFEAVSEFWESVVRGDEPSLAERARVKLAEVQSAALCVDTVERAYEAAGAAAVYASSPFERCLRDVRAGRQHITVSRGTLQDAGRVLLGLEPLSPL